MFSSAKSSIAFTHCTHTTPSSSGGPRHQRRAFGLISVCAALCLSGCGSDNEPEDGGGGTAPTSGAGGSGGSASTTGGGGGAGATCPAAPDFGVRYVGRVDGCQAGVARYAWSGSGFVGRFNGTGVSVKLTDPANEHAVLIDGEPAPKLVASGADTYTLATGLEPGEHTFEVYRRTEPSFGITLLEGVEVEDGELLEPPAAPERRIEVIGDSITCGYGNEGTAPCSFSAETENNYLAYGSILARTFEAEPSTVAISGKGVIYNYNGNRVLPLPTLYDTTVPDDRKRPWSFAWQPDLVLINLGTNDFSGVEDPTAELFTSAYQKFLEHIRAVYPDTFILCTVGPMLTGADLEQAREGIAAAVDARGAAGDERVKAYEMTTPNATPACDYHPSLATHEAMAAELADEVRLHLDW